MLSAQEGVLASFGLHPWYISERTDWWLDKLETLLVASPGAGVGELGLDHAMDKFTHGLQEEIFLYQLRLANRLNRTVSIHCRRAFERMITLLEKEGGVGPGGVLHSFSGPKELIPSLKNLDCIFLFQDQSPPKATGEGLRRSGRFPRSACSSKRTARICCLPH